MNKVLEIYTDGASRNNQTTNRHAACAYVIVDQTKIIKSTGKYLGNQTNNYAELYAVKLALDWLMPKKWNLICDLYIYTDSQIVHKTFHDWIDEWKKNNWKRSGGQEISNLELIKDIDDIKPDNIYWNWVRGHSGNKYNEMADMLCNNILDKHVKIPRS